MPTFPASDRGRHQSKVEKALAGYVSDRCAGVAKALRSRTAAATDDWWDESEAEAEATDALSGPVRDASLAAAGHITRKLVKGGFDPNADFDSAVDDRVSGAGAAYAAVVRDDLQRRIDDAGDGSLAAEAVDTYGAETQRPGVVAAYETAWAVAFGSTAGGTAAQEDEKADGRTVTRTWVLSPDHGDPDECDDNEGASFAADEEADVDLPAHYGCLPAFVRVAGGVVPADVAPEVALADSLGRVGDAGPVGGSAASTLALTRRDWFPDPPHATMQRWYEGDLVEVETVGGRLLTATPNHPVLRSGGWCPAGNLVPGDDVVSSTAREWTEPGDPDENDRPPPIVDVVGALNESGQMCSGAVPVAPEDFHGDGGASDVAVVATDGLLRDRRQSSVVKPPVEPVFPAGHLGGGLTTEGHSDPLLFGGTSAPSSDVGGGSEGSVLFGSAPGGVHPGRLPDASGRDPVLSEEPEDGHVVDARLIADCLGVGTGDVALDYVLRVRRYPSFSHVFNLSTATGWYVAGGLVVHNCECEWEIDWADAVTASGRIVPLVADAIPAHQTDTEDVPFDAAEMSRNLAIGDGEAEYRQAHAWQDPEGNPDAKSSYRWLHHHVSPKGLVGAANMGACLSGINSLNRGASIPDGDREGTYEHMASHLRDGGKDVPDLAEPVTASGHVWDACSPEVMARFAAANPEAVTAAAADGSPGGVGGSWHGVLTMEGLRTTDGREIAPDALDSRQLPLPFAFLVETTGGHQEARLCGRIDSVSRDTAGRILGEGVFDTGPDGVEAERLVSSGMLRWCSIDPEVIEWELVLDGGGSVDIMDLFFGDIDPNTVTERWTKANLMGATLCMWPAFPGATITMADVPLPSASDPGPHEAHPIPLVVAASAALGSMWWESDDRPPAAWFDHPDDPNHDGFVLTDEGRLYGYVAPEGLRHVGITDRRVTVPVCDDYDRFCVGVVKAMAAEGVVRPVRTGPIVMGTGHADKRADWREATRHYDNTGAAVADITVGNDEHGVWFAGCVRPTITAEQLYVLNATRRVSGDWRPIEQAGQPTQLEMVGVLAVNAGGFPQRASVVASLVQQWAPDTGATSVGFRGEEVTSLVACMPPPGQSSAMAALRARVEALESAVRPLRPLALERIAAKMLR